jgi:hypothetical protein
MHSVDIETRHGAGNYLRSLESRIRERAYEIWTARGCVQGQDDQHWLAAEREILTEWTATLAVPETGASVARSRSKKSDWQRELRIKFFGMLFGVGIAAAAAFSLGAHHNGSAPASPGPIRETAASASAPTVGAEVTAARVEATGVDTDRASTASDVTSDSKSNVATTCDTCGGAWTNVPETPAPSTSPRPPAPGHTKPVASQRSAAAADRPNTKLGRAAGDGSSGHNGFWAWSR